jgi:hypothetical protein
MNKDGTGTLVCLLRPIVCMTIPGVLSKRGGFLTGVIEGIAGVREVRERGKGKGRVGRREKEGGKVRAQEGRNEGWEIREREQFRKGREGR